MDHEGGIVAYPYPPAPAERARPTSVTVSSYLLFVVAAIQLISAIVGLSQVGTTARVLKDAYAGTAAAGAESVAGAVGVASAVFAILFAAGLSILAIFNNRGRQGSRVTTWVIGGLALCCNGFSVLGNAATRSMSLDSGGTTGPSATEVQRQLDAALPSWYGAATVTLAVLALVCLLAAIVLLALPASNAFFRKVPAAGFDPTYGAGYAAPSPYPQAPYGGPPPGYPPPGSYGPPGAPGSYPQPGQPGPYAPPGSQPSYGPPGSQPPSGPASDPWGAPPSSPPPAAPGSPDDPRA
jgi:hypothetical protein